MKNIEHKKVRVKIRTEQKQHGEMPAVVDFIADGELIQTDQGWNVIYRESAEGMLSDTISTISVHGKNISMDHIGSIDMSMNFIEGRHHINRVSTPYGIIDVGFLTNRVYCKMNRNGGRIRLSYIMHYSDEYPVETTLRIAVNPA